MLCALGVVVLCLGSIVDVLDLSSAALASMIIIMAMVEFGTGWATLIYGATGILGLVLLPVKTPALLYLVFAGYYPIIKLKIEKLGKIVSYIVKVTLFNIALTAVILICKYVLLIPDEIMGAVYLLYIVGNVTFIVYDIALGRIILVYAYYLRDKLKIGKFLKKR